MKSSYSEGRRKLRTVVEAVLLSGIVATTLWSMSVYAQQPAVVVQRVHLETDSNSAAIDKSYITAKFSKRCAVYARNDHAPRASD
jgi:hypothetical protein